MDKGTPYFITGFFLTSATLFIKYLKPFHFGPFPNSYFLVPAAAFILGIIAIAIDYQKSNNLLFLVTL